MTIEQALVAYVNADGTIGAAIYADQMPQTATLPALVYQRIGTSVIQTKDGPVTMVPVTFQITAWADTIGDAKTLADAVRKSLCNGMARIGTYDGVEIQDVLWTNEIDHYDSNTLKRGRVQTYRIWFTEDF